MPSGYSPNLIYILECEHKIWGRGMMTSMRCPVCNTIRHVSDIQLREWHSSCQNCRYGRWFGLVKSNAERGANAHHRATGHMVSVTFDKRLDAERLKNSLARNRMLAPYMKEVG